MASPDPGPDASPSAAPPDWYSYGLDRLFYYRIAQAAASALPRPGRLRPARGLGRLLSLAVPAERSAVRSNLARVLAGASPRELDRRVSETFANFGAFFADLLTLNRRPAAGLGADVASAEGEHPIGPFVLARVAGAAVVTAFRAMAPGGRYRLEIDTPMWGKPGEEASALASSVAALERAIRAYPTQWFNFFDAWSPPHGHA